MQISLHTQTDVCKFVDALSNINSRGAGIHWRRSEMFPTELFQQLRRSATVSPLTRSRRAVGLRQTDHGAKLAQVSILQINRRLADDIVRAQQIVVFDAYSQVFRQRNTGFQLKHSAFQQLNS